MREVTFSTLINTEIARHGSNILPKPVTCSWSSAPGGNQPTRQPRPEHLSALTQPPDHHAWRLRLLGSTQLPAKNRSGPERRRAKRFVTNPSPPRWPLENVPPQLLLGVCKIRSDANSMPVPLRLPLLRSTACSKESDLDSPTRSSSAPARFWRRDVIPAKASEREARSLLARVLIRSTAVPVGLNPTTLSPAAK